MLEATELLRCLSAAAALSATTVQKSAIAAGSVAGSSASAGAAASAAAALLLPRVLRLAPSGREAVAAEQPVPSAGTTRTGTVCRLLDLTCSDLPCERGGQADMDFKSSKLNSSCNGFIAF